MLLSDARAALRKLDALLALPIALDDPSLPDITELRAAADRLVTQLPPPHGGRAAPGPRRRPPALLTLR